jgi:hypothetical protein
VDFGESFVTGALRETREEGGIDVKLDGLALFDIEETLMFTRARAIFLASPIDESQPTRHRDQNDGETSVLEALWLTCDQIAEKEPKRSWEPVMLFNWVLSGKCKPTPIVPLLNGVDGPLVSHTQVTCSLAYRVTVLIVRTSPTNAGRRLVLCFRTSSSAVGAAAAADGSLRLPSKPKHKHSNIRTLATSILSPLVGAKDGWWQLEGVLEVKHVPPVALDAVGLIQVAYVASVPSEEAGEQALVEHPNELCWLEIDSASESDVQQQQQQQLSSLDTESQRLIQLLLDPKHVVAPISLVRNKE